MVFTFVSVRQDAGQVVSFAWAVLITRRSRPTSKPPVDLRLSDDCFVSSDSHLSGTIVLGPGCIIHPRSTIIVSGTLTLGANCVVEENSIITASGSSSIGANNSFQVGCRVDLVPGVAVGDWNVFAPRSEVKGVKVGNECTFGAGTVVGPGCGFEGRDRIIVYGAASEWRVWDGSAARQEQSVRASSAAFLREVLPKCVNPRVC